MAGLAIGKETSARFRYATIGAAVVFLILIALTVILTKGIVNDDTYITLRYSRNLIRYHHFTYNLNSPTYSLTTPFWAISIAAFGWLSDNLVIIAQVLSAALTFAAAILLYRLGSCIVGSYALLPVVMFPLDPYLIGADYCGTEMALFSLLALAAACVVVKCEFTKLRSLWTALLFALLFVTRPEGMVIGSILMLYVIIFFWKRGGLSFAIRTSLLAILVLVPWFIYAELHFKTIIPISVILKSIGATKRLPFSDGIVMKTMMILMAKGYFPYFLLILSAFIVLCFKREQSFNWKSLFMNDQSANGEGRIASRGVQLLPLMLVIGLILLYSGGLKERAMSTRYFVTFSPYIMILATQSFSVIERRFLLFHRHGVAVLALVACLMILINVAAMNSRIKRCLEGDAPRVAAGQWIAENISARSVIATFGGAGGIAYFCDNSVWDYDLISSGGRDLELAKKRRQGYSAKLYEYFYKKPDYFVTLKESSDFDYLGRTVYCNGVYKVVEVVNKREAFKDYN